MPEAVRPCPRPAPAPRRRPPARDQRHRGGGPDGRPLWLLCPPRAAPVPFDPLDAEVGAADYGQMVHEAMARWTRRLETAPGGWPGAATALEWFEEAAEAALEEAAARPGLLAFWRPRLSRIGAFVVAQEEAMQRGQPVRTRHAEVPGHLDLAQGQLRLKVRADRIDLLADRTLSIIDYKTGMPPSNKEVQDGRAPQMPLEAAIAAAGGFQGWSRAPSRRSPIGGSPAAARRAR
ncbi:PD-(D/E)XK nuclease family protein [Teichococcus aestuarii]|uniref:PD-(D/E)XK nuclease family protein n=1 Tax=Teichococcus aestuarii TaxID=568898 RepID=UPI0036117DE4